MERQEPRFDKDMQDVEFRPRAYRGPSLSAPSRDNDGFAWKLGVAVGIGVLAALLIFSAYERYQARRDAEQALQVLKHEAAKLECEARVAIRTVTVPTPLWSLIQRFIVVQLSAAHPGRPQRKIEASEGLHFQSLTPKECVGCLCSGMLHFGAVRMRDWW